MTQRLKESLIVVAAVAALVAGYFVFDSWRSAHDAAIQARAEVKTQEAQNQQLAVQIKQLSDQQAALTQQLTQQLQVLASIKQQVQTPAQIVSTLPQYVQQPLPQPITITTPAPTAANPNPQPVAAVPSADLKAIFDQLVDCKGYQDQATTCGKQLSLAQQQQDDLKQELTATQKERDEWKTAARGGSFWTRLKKNAKWFAIGAGTGAAIALVH